MEVKTEIRVMKNKISIYSLSVEDTKAIRVVRACPCF